MRITTLFILALMVASFSAMGAASNPYLAVPTNAASATDGQVVSKSGANTKYITPVALSSNTINNASSASIGITTNSTTLNTPFLKPAVTNQWRSDITNFVDSGLYDASFKSMVVTPTADAVGGAPAAFRGFTGGTADILEIQNGLNAVLAGFNSNGVFYGDMSGGTNLNGAKIQAGTVNSNALDTGTKALLGSGTGGVAGVTASGSATATTNSGVVNIAVTGTGGDVTTAQLQGSTNTTTLNSQGLALSSAVIARSGGTGTGNTLTNATLWNGTNQGLAFSSPGSVAGSEAFGGGSVSTAPGSLAFGPQADATGTNSVAIGSTAVAANNRSVAIGRGATVTADFATAVGPNTGSTFANSTALGKGAATTATNQIMLGTSADTVVIPGGLQSTAAGGTSIAASGDSNGLTVTNSFSGATAITAKGTNGTVTINTTGNGDVTATSFIGVASQATHATNADNATLATSATAANFATNLTYATSLGVTAGTRTFTHDGTHTLITNTATLTSSEWTAGSQFEWYNGAKTITIGKTNGSITLSNMVFNGNGTALPTTTAVGMLGIDSTGNVVSNALPSVSGGSFGSTNTSGELILTNDLRLGKAGGLGNTNTFEVWGTNTAPNFEIGTNGAVHIRTLGASGWNDISIIGSTITLPTSPNSVTIASGNSIFGPSSISSGGGIQIAAGNNLHWGSAGYVYDKANGSLIALNANLDKIGSFQGGVTNVTKTANYTNLFSEAGCYFDNIGAGGAITNTLPPTIRGSQFDFYVDAAQTYAIQVPPGGADQIRYNNATVGTYLFSSQTNSTVHMFCPKTNVWIIDHITGTWTGPQ
jgi:hypothetical protein